MEDVAEHIEIVMGQKFSSPEAAIAAARARAERLRMMPVNTRRFSPNRFELALLTAILAKPLPSQRYH
jgi:hypothetical protein